MVYERWVWGMASLSISLLFHPWGCTRPAPQPADIVCPPAAAAVFLKHDTRLPEGLPGPQLSFSRRSTPFFFGAIFV